MQRRKIEKITKVIFKYYGVNGETAQRMTLFGACKRWSEDLILRQYAKRHRCVCGRRDKFCDFYVSSDKKLCRKKKQLRVIKLAKRIYRQQREEEKTNEQNQQNAGKGHVFKPSDVFAAHGRRSDRIPK